MANKKSKPSQAELREFRSKWAKLRSKGLVKNDARSQKMTKHAKRQLKKYVDVLAGNADVVSVPRGKAKSYDAFVRSGNKVVVPKAKGTKSRAYYSTKRKAVVRTLDYPGGTRVTALVTTGMTEADLRALEGKDVTFSVHVSRGGGYQIYRRRKIAELSEIFADGSWKNFEGWASHVMVEYSVTNKQDEDEDEDA